MCHAQLVYVIDIYFVDGAASAGAGANSKFAVPLRTTHAPHDARLTRAAVCTVPGAGVCRIATLAGQQLTIFLPLNADNRNYMAYKYGSVVLCGRTRSIPVRVDVPICSVRAVAEALSGMGL